MKTIGNHARLIINGKHVGRVRVRSFADSWGFGDFQPGEAFAEFAPLFGKWSLLIHADDDQRRLSQATSDELRRVELALDGLRCSLVFDDLDHVLDLRQLNIDGPLIDWKLGQRRRLVKQAG
jgi:hypothetical protein